MRYRTGELLTIYSLKTLSCQDETSWDYIDIGESLRRGYALWMAAY